MKFTERLIHAWNVFRSRDPTESRPSDGFGYSFNPNRVRLTRGAEKSIITSIYNRIAMDVAAVTIQHVRLDAQGRYLEPINSRLNDCFRVEANIDQSGREFIHDVVLSMLDEGVVAIVPIDMTSTLDVCSMRVAKILEWKPQHIKVLVYNEELGRKEEVWVPKKLVAIVENPLYSVINEPNSTIQRLIRKLSLLDMTDEQTASGKLDLIIQLPYVVKTEARREQAERRRAEIENQLVGSKYGIAYTDGTEHITQLNRSLENNLQKQVEYLTDMVFSQIGVTQEILNGSADEKAMLNYNNRIVEPILAAIANAMIRKFLTKTARTQGQTIMFFQEPFRLISVDSIAELADKLTRNEIATSNEIRQLIGWKPSTDPSADELRNKNLNQAAEESEADDPVREEQNEVEDDEL